MALRLGDTVPDFTQESTEGPLHLFDWMGDGWAVLFSHPADFTPVCTTEFVGFARHAEDFTQRGVKLIGNSIDSIFSHIAWVRDIEKNNNIKIPFPVIADLDQKVAMAYGMVHEPMAVTATVRCVFVIDPQRIVRAIIYYPLNVGRNMDEIERLLDALQTSDAKSIATPVNWAIGDKVIVPPPKTVADVAERETHSEYERFDFYLNKTTV